MGEETRPRLAPVSFQIHRNEYLAIMGPSGSGKSTLVNSLSYLDTPTTTGYEFNGRRFPKWTTTSSQPFAIGKSASVFRTFNLLQDQRRYVDVEPLIYAGVDPERRDTATQVLEDVAGRSAIPSQPNESFKGNQ